MQSTSPNNNLFLTGVVCVKILKHVLLTTKFKSIKIKKGSKENLCETKKGWRIQNNN